MGCYGLIDLSSLTLKRFFHDLSSLILKPFRSCFEFWTSCCSSVSHLSIFNDFYLIGFLNFLIVLISCQILCFDRFKHNNTFWLSLLKLGWWFEKTASLTRLLHLQFSQALVSGSLVYLKSSQVLVGSLILWKLRRNVIYGLIYLFLSEVVSRVSSHELVTRQLFTWLRFYFFLSRNTYHYVKLFSFV